LRAAWELIEGGKSARHRSGTRGLAGQLAVEGGAEPGQQGVASRMAEGVVVRLEAVEVAEDQQQRVGGGGLGQRGVEVGDQPVRL
jgi:hypothetical protein